MDNNQIYDQTIFLLRHERIVKQVAGALARRLHPMVDIDDLIQDGYVGLLVAYQRAAREGYRFEDEAHISQRVRGAMLDGLRQADHFSRRTRSKMRRVKSTVHLLEHSLGKPPRDADISKALDMPLSAFQKFMALICNNEILYLDEGGDSILSELSSAHAEDPSALHEQQEDLVVLMLAMDELGEKEYEVLNAYFFEGLDLKDIGKRLGVSESRICQLKNRAISRLRARIGYDSSLCPAC